ncbi:hypothetical protein Tco_0716978 [Tanacetum coccineum]
MTTSIDEDVEKSSLVNQDDIGSGVSSIKPLKNDLLNMLLPQFLRSSRSDHRHSRRDSTEYRDRLEPSPRDGRDYRDYDNKRSGYESSRRTPDSDFDIAKSLTALVSQLVIHYSKPLLLPIKRGERTGMTSEQSR